MGRIVSLLPSGTEIVCALGLGDELVAVSHACDFPAPVVDGLPRVTSSILEQGLTSAQIDAAVAAAGLASRPLYAVDGALLASLEPTLIVTQGVCAVCAVTPQTVEGALSPLDLACQAPVLSLSGEDRLGVQADILALGEATGRGEAAAKMVAQMEARWAAVEAARPAAAPRVAMLEWPEPPWFGGHWVPQQVAAAGGVDVLGRPGQPSGRTSWEAVVAADPEVLVVMACGFGLERNAQEGRRVLAEIEGLAEVTAVKRAQVWAADANALFSRPTARIVDGAEGLGRIFNGLEPDPAHFVRLV